MAQLLINRRQQIRGAASLRRGILGDDQTLLFHALLFDGDGCRLSASPPDLNQKVRADRGGATQKARHSTLDASHVFGQTQAREINKVHQSSALAGHGHDEWSNVVCRPVVAGGGASG
jgi:hypothetical protein